MSLGIVWYHLEPLEVPYSDKKLVENFSERNLFLSGSS